jgi:hypothetical protein
MKRIGLIRLIGPLSLIALVLRVLGALRGPSRFFF